MKLEEWVSEGRYGGDHWIVIRRQDGGFVADGHFGSSSVAFGYGKTVVGALDDLTAALAKRKEVLGE